MKNTKLRSKNLVEISRFDLECSISQEATITDVKHLASYNWLDAPSPTIAVPGTPARWTAPKGPQQLKKDSGLVYIDQNAARHPDSPLEPLFRSLRIEQPSFGLNSVDVVTDRNNVRKLLSFINPSLAKGPLGPYTIQIEMAAQTAIFCRDEAVTYEVIGHRDFRGFGHEFEKAYTTSQIQDSTGHHRIISYRLGGLHFLVRHETDGFVGDIETTGDDLATVIDSLSLSPRTTPAEKASSLSKLRIKREGQALPRETTLEIKTRVLHKHLDMEEVASQLWVSQTPKLVRAYHQRGRFSNPKAEDVTTKVKDWESTHQKDIAQLVALIKQIVHVTGDFGGSTAIRYTPLKDRLVIEKTERKKMLPDDLYALWTKDNGVSQMSQECPDLPGKDSVVIELSGISTVSSQMKTHSTGLRNEADLFVALADSNSEA